MCMGFSVEVAFAIPFYLNQPLSMHVQSGRGSFEAFTEFQFDGVLPSGCQQVDVYNTAARPVVLVRLPYDSVVIRSQDGFDS